MVLHVRNVPSAIFAHSGVRGTPVNDREFRQGEEGIHPENFMPPVKYKMEHCTLPGRIPYGFENGICK